MAALLFGIGGSVAYAESVDTTGPVVSSVTPLVATAGQSVMLNSSFMEDISGINYCYLIVNGTGLSGDMTRSGGSFSGTLTQSYTFPSAGSYRVAVRCYDLAANVGQSPDATVVVSASAPSDVTPPTVNMPAVVASVGVGTPVTFSATYSDVSDVPSCRFIVNGEVQATLPGTGTSGSVSFTRSFSSSGPYAYYFSCTDASGNIGFSPTRSLSVTGSSGDGVAPVVGPLNPATAVVGTAVTFSATYTDAVGVVSCELDPGTSTTYPATLSGPMTNGTAARAYTFTTAGIRTVYMRCSDAAGNVGTATQSVHVYTSTVGNMAPVVSGVSPSTAVVGTPVTFSVTFSDDVSVNACSLYVDNALVGTATLVGSSSGTASRSYTFSTAGTHVASYICYDGQGASRDTGNYTVTVSGGTGIDSIFPSFTSSINPTSVSVNTINTYSVAYTDNVGVTRCDVYADYVLAGYASLSGSTSGNASWSQTFSTGGTHVMRFECQDAAGNRSATANVAIYVTAGSSSDTIPPTVGFVGPTSAVANVQTTLSTYVNDNQTGVSRCELYVNGVTYGSMDIYGGNVSRAYTFPYAGTYSVYARCWDMAGNATTGPVSSVIVSGSNNGGMYGTATMGSLMKSVCPGYYVAADHPCHAVYYFGRDGRRHAFPNANVYFTWYSDFSRVVEVSDAFLASVPLGRNVTYRPGIRLVKFTTVNRVYAVGRGGVLRWITTEDLARQLYGYNWATQVDDIADVFYTNYTFGSDIYTSGQFNPAGEAALAPTIDDNF